MEELKEEWKLVNGYKISNHGIIIGKNGKQLSTKPSSHGYLSCHINLGEPYGMARGQHRVIAMLFVENPNNYNEVNHKDANKKNNKADNLEWVTHQENMTHVSVNRLYPTTKYCCIIDDEGNIAHTFNSTVEARTFLPNSAHGIKKCMDGITNTIHNYKFRIWLPEENSYVKTRYDDPNYEWKSTRHRKILCEQNGKIYKNQSQASKDLGVLQSAISMHLLYGNKCGEYTFKYASE